MSDDDNVSKLGVRFKKPVEDEDKMLTLVSKYDGCIKHSYVIDAEAKEITCSKCDKVFNPMAVLVELCHQESKFMANLKRYASEMKRLDKRKRTKCQKCGEMTTISWNR